MTWLPDDDVSFYWAAAAQLDPELRPAFAARVVAALDANPDPGPGDLDRAVRQAFAALWVPPPIEAVRVPPRWARSHARAQRGARSEA